MPCNRPGCVSQTVDGKTCAVHSGPVATACTRCFGAGTLRRHFKDEPCDLCCGVGLRDEKRRAAPAPKPAPVDERDLMRVMADE